MRASNSTKIFLAVLFLIGLLFIVGINIGAMHSDDQTFSPPGWLSGLGATLAHPQPLKMTDLSPASANCLQQGRFVISAGNTCTFAIQQSSFTQRVIMLQLVQGTSALATLTQEQVLPVQQSLPSTDATPNADLKVYPGKAHGVLAIKCLNAGGAPACLLLLK